MICDFRPFPGNGAYGHWTCQKPRHHRGRHRFENYTIARVPRFWHLRRLWGAWKADRRLKRINPAKGGYGYRRVLYPTAFNPRRPQEDPS